MTALVPVATILVLNVFGLQLVPLCGSAEGVCQQLPANIRTSPQLKPVLIDLLTKSEIFRRQCAKIAAAPRLWIHVDITTVPLGALTRARARASRYDTGLLFVAIEVPPASDYVELLVHEFEHVTELLEGVDFRTLAGESSEVRERSDGTFETERARAAASAASQEVYGAVDPTIVAAGRFLRRATRATWRAIALLRSR